MIDHEKHIGRVYEPKRPRTDEERKRLSDAMKALHHMRT